MAVQTLGSQPTPVEVLLDSQNLEVFYPLKPTFLEQAYNGIDLDVQKLCNLARKIAESIYHLPLQADCPVPAGQVMESCTRILAHLKLVDYLEQRQLCQQAKVKIYIDWVQEAAKECFKLLATGLAEHQTLSNIYVKNPIRQKIDERGGSSKAVPVEKSDDLKKIELEIFKHPFKLVFFNQVDVRGYMAPLAEQLVADKKGSLYQSLSVYIFNPENTVQIYPHESENGRIFSNFFENREYVVLKDELVMQSLTEKVKSLNLTVQSIEAIIQTTLSEESIAIKKQTEAKLRQDIQEVVNERKEITLTPKELSIVHVQDHYPVEDIVKQVVASEPIDELRKAIYVKAKGNESAQAPHIRYPRVTYYATTREGYNLIDANYAIEYLNGHNEQLKQLANLLTIGIRRFVDSYKEQQRQEQEDKELRKLLVELNVKPLDLQ